MSSEGLNSPRFSLLDRLLGGTVLGAPSPITGPDAREAELATSRMRNRHDHPRLGPAPVSRGWALTRLEDEGRHRLAALIPGAQEHEALPHVSPA